MAVPSYLTPAEVRQLQAAITSPRDQAIFQLLFWRGLRASEVGLLRPEWLDLDRGRLQVHRVKGSYSGEYRLQAQEVDALRRWLRVRGQGFGPLFPSRKGGPISRGQIWGLMRKYGRAAGLPAEKCHPHV